MGIYSEFLQRSGKVKVGTGVMHIDPNAKNGPEDVTVVPFFSDLNLKWEEDDTAESYVIYIDDQKVGETEELSYHVTGLDYNTSYSVRRSVCLFGWFRSKSRSRTDKDRKYPANYTQRRSDPPQRKLG